MFISKFLVPHLELRQSDWIRSAMFSPMSPFLTAVTGVFGIELLDIRNQNRYLVISRFNNFI